MGKTIQKIYLTADPSKFQITEVNDSVFDMTEKFKRLSYSQDMTIELYGDENDFRRIFMSNLNADNRYQFQKANTSTLAVELTHLLQTDKKKYKELLKLLSQHKIKTQLDIPGAVACHSIREALAYCDRNMNDIKRMTKKKGEVTTYIGKYFNLYLVVFDDKTQFGNLDFCLKLKEFSLIGYISKINFDFIQSKVKYVTPAIIDDNNLRKKERGEKPNKIYKKNPYGTFGYDGIGNMQQEFLFESLIPDVYPEANYNDKPDNYLSNYEQDANIDEIVYHEDFLGNINESEGMFAPIENGVFDTDDLLELYQQQFDSWLYKSQTYKPEVKIEKQS